MGAASLRHSLSRPFGRKTSLFHFTFALWRRKGRPLKNIQAGATPQNHWRKKNRKISQFLLSLNFPISLAKSSFSSLESSKSEVNQSFKFRPSDLFKSVSFSVLSSGVFFPFWIAYIIQIFSPVASIILN